VEVVVVERMNVRDVAMRVVLLLLLLWMMMMMMMAMKTMATTMMTTNHGKVSMNVPMPLVDALPQRVANAGREVGEAQ
jgi:hypothetical protein